MRDLEEKAHGEAATLKWNEAAAAVTEGLTGDAFVLTRSEGLWAVRTLDAWRHLNAAPQAPAQGGDAVSDAALADAARKSLGTWLAWPDAPRDGPVPVTNEQAESWLHGLPAALANHSPDAGGVGEAEGAAWRTVLNLSRSLGKTREDMRTAFSLIGSIAEKQLGRPDPRGEE